MSTKTPSVSVSPLLHNPIFSIKRRANDVPCTDVILGRYVSFEPGSLGLIVRYSTYTGHYEPVKGMADLLDE